MIGFNREKIEQIFWLCVNGLGVSEIQRHFEFYKVSRSCIYKILRNPKHVPKKLFEKAQIALMNRKNAVRGIVTNEEDKWSFKNRYTNIFAGIIYDDRNIKLKLRRFEVLKDGVCNIVLPHYYGKNIKIPLFELERVILFYEVNGMPFFRDCFTQTASEFDLIRRNIKGENVTREIKHRYLFRTIFLQKVSKIVIKPKQDKKYDICIVLKTGKEVVINDPSANSGQLY